MFIAVEGCVGVGKSTVVKGLTQLRDSEPLFENYELNPFLSQFYNDPDAFALETEFAFLLIHYHQLKHSLSGNEGEVISDFTIRKDMLYAELNINNLIAKNAFHEVYDLFQRELVVPDLTVCLEASDTLMLERIRIRNRAFELQADPEYYIRLNAAFRTLFEKHEGPQLRVNMDESDFIANPALFLSLSAEIDKLINQQDR